jgi:hypothetical protein
MNNLAKSKSYSYSIFSFVTDQIRSSSVPVGIALWSAEPQQVRIKLASDKEKIKGIKGTAYDYLRVFKSQLDQWLKSGHLPYGAPTASPHSDSWWVHLSELLVHNVRLSEPRPIDCRDVEQDLELLYEAVVGPDRDAKERSERIDRVLSRSLGSLTRRLDRGAVAGFHGRPVSVKHFKAVGRQLVIVEGVNLAAAAAEDDTDALVSRLQRIKEANGQAHDRSVVAFVGYLSSPHGLNGEAVLVDWIRKKTEAQTFDLVEERDQFQGNVEGVIESMEAQRRSKSMFT